MTNKTHDINMTGITIKALGPADEQRVRDLAGRDSAERPEGHLIGVEVEGRLLAAASIETGATIADPFSRTRELTRLLRLRRRQLRSRPEAEEWPQPRSSGAMVSPASASISQ